MPWALASGHAMGDDGPVSTAVSTLFNGISIGFKTPEVVEGLLPFEDALGDYTKWTDPAAVSVVWTQETPHPLFLSHWQFNLQARILMGSGTTILLKDVHCGTSAEFSAFS